MKERVTKLIYRFSKMKSGEQILVGVQKPATIMGALHAMRREALVMKTADRATRDDGVSVPVYLVTFT
jgi:hypothetical protein